MSHGFQVFNSSGDLDFSVKGRSPRIFSTGVIMVPNTGNVVISGRLLYQYSLSVPEITSTTGWWIVYLPITGASYSYAYAQVYSTSISVGGFSLLIDVPFRTVPLRYVVMRLL